MITKWRRVVQKKPLFGAVVRRGVYYTDDKCACCIFKRYKPRPPYPSIFPVSSGWLLRQPLRLLRQLCRIKPQSTYIHRVQISVWLASSELLTPHPLSTQRVCPQPAPKAGGTQDTLAVRCGGGGSIFRKTSDIGLASYSIILLRINHTLCALHFDHGPRATAVAVFSIGS